MSGNISDIRRQCERDSSLDGWEVIVEEICCEGDGGKLDCEYDMACIVWEQSPWEFVHSSDTDFMIWEEPECEENDLCECLSCNVMGSELFNLSLSLPEHVQLCEHCDALQVKCESPSDVRAQLHVQWWMEERRENHCRYREVVPLHRVLSSIFMSVSVEDARRHHERSDFRDSIQQVTSRIRWQVSIGEEDRSQTRKRRKCVADKHVLRETVLPKLTAVAS